MGTLYSKLLRLAKGRREDFHTEVLAWLLELLREREPELFVGVLSWFGMTEPGAAKDWKVSTQSSDEFGRTDLELDSSDCHLIVEVKVDAGVHGDQLPRYQGKLKNRGARHSALALLTVFNVEEGEAAMAQVCRRWSELSVWLEEAAAKDEVCRWAITEFVKFLHEGKVVMGKVDKSLVDGVASMMNLLAMITESLERQKIKNSSSSGTAYNGRYVDWKNFWVGVSYKFGETMVRWANEAAWVNKEMVKVLGVGEMQGEYWRYWLDLTDFFDLNKAEQQQRVDEFVRVGWKTAQAIQLPGPPDGSVVAS